MRSIIKYPELINKHVITRKFDPKMIRADSLTINWFAATSSLVHHEQPIPRLNRWKK